jgi:uncharacterized protein involved in type VI secretion and phage assembly
MAPATKCAGLYRAIVVDVADPLKKRRVRVRVPDASTSTVWARACVPAGSRTQPAAGSMVWVMFENGDPDYPVWIGTLPT